MKQRVAVIGSGIAGMGAAYFLHPEFDITLFEKNEKVGGHTNTVFVEQHDQQIPIDTGFMVFNYQTYPLLTRLFEKLQLAVQKTDMSFSVCDEQTSLEWRGADFSGLFGQRKNLFNLRYWRFLMQLNRFNTEAKVDVDDTRFENTTLQEYVEIKGYGKDFIAWYLVPMSGAIWSAEARSILTFPTARLLRFFNNHGFLGQNTQHQWYTVTGGASRYIEPLLSTIPHKLYLNARIAKVVQADNQAVLVMENSESLTFDKVIFACHADQALALIEAPSSKQNELLGSFKYQKNHTLLHTDKSIMPHHKKCWAAWNYRVTSKKEASTHYWMNKLQGISPQQQYFVSLNASQQIKEEHIVKELQYEHPMFTLQSYKAQQELEGLNRDTSPLYFCGSYFRHGFHEDALWSSFELARLLLKTSTPWP
jgi:uncharacterized protein